MSDPWRGHDHYLRENKQGDVRELAQLLAPLEETDPEVLKSYQSIKGDDTIVVDAESVGLSQDLTEGNDDKRAVGIEPAALALLIVMLLFIAFIAYEAYYMPTPAN
jgi:hypothetical protein